MTKLDKALKFCGVIGKILDKCGLKHTRKHYEMGLGYCATCLMFPNKNLFFSKFINSFFKDFEHFDTFTSKSWDIYKGSDKRLKEIYKRHETVYPKNRIKFYYNANEISMNKNFAPDNLENRLKFTNRNLVIKKNYNCNEVLGFDTETYEGTCRLICRNDNGSKRKQNYVFKPTFDDCLEFLTYHINKSNVYRFFFNIDFDITAILKLYKGKDKLLFMEKISKGIAVEYVNKKHSYIFKWIRNRMFSIKVKGRKKRAIVFSDIYTFYNISLGKAGLKYLNIGKNKIDGNKLNTDLKYWKNNKDKIIKYCIKDCNLTKDLGVLLIDKINDLGLGLPKLLISPASLSKQNFRYENYISSLKHTPIKITQIAYNCYFGGRFEVLKRGYFNKLYLYDIVSQYPTFIRDLPNMSSGYWKMFKNLKELPKNQCIGYFKVLVKIPMNEILPTLPLKRKNLVVFSNGTFLGWFCWYDLDLMRKYIVSIKKAYIFQDVYNNKPFFNKINEFFAIKNKIDKKKDELGYNITKLGMNGLYGCFIEKHENYYYDDDKKEFNKRFKAGILFNPIYASQITSYGRWSVIKDIPNIKRKHIIAIHTDSIITDLEFSKYLNIGMKLGNWNLENTGKSVIIGTGIYQIGKKVKTRGIPFKLVKNWFKLIKKNPNKESITFVIKHFKKIREALVQDKSIINTNRMFDIEKKLSCNCDLKRNWYDEFSNFNDLVSRNITSLPYFSFESEFSFGLNPIVVSDTQNISLDITTSILRESPY